MISQLLDFYFVLIQKMQKQICVPVNMYIKTAFILYLEQEHDLATSKAYAANSSIILHGSARALQR